MSLMKEKIKAQDPAILILGAYGVLLMMAAYLAIILGQDRNVMRDLALCGGIFFLLSLHFVNERLIVKLKKRIEDLEAKA